MNETLNNVLNLHKIEEHKWEIENSPFSLKEIINTIEITFHNLLLSKKISFITSVIPNIIVSDRIKIQHIISNLVSNAIKFSFDNGIINLTIKKDESNIIIIVKDTGHGILLENQDKLFKNYSQILPNSIQEGGGTGLGLMFCKNIVNLLGGDIYLKSSNIGEGSVFECKIPVRFKNSELEKDKKETTSLHTIFPQYSLHSNKNDSNHINVAIIDDHEASRNILMMYMKKIGVNKLSCAENGLIAYNMISSNLDTYHLLIVDNLMPIMSGVEMTKKLRNLGYEFLIIGLTGNVMDEDMNEFFKAGADYVLMKPLKIKEMYNLIDFIKNNGFISKTSTNIKLINANNTFEWIHITPVKNK
jgi:CheY-like chemotaxis protein/two-component sensor histidine kinase